MFLETSLRPKRSLISSLFFIQRSSSRRAPRYRQDRFHRYVSTYADRSSFEPSAHLSFPSSPHSSFTGSTAIGKHLASTAALSNLKVVTLELGGKLELPLPHLLRPTKELTPRRLFLFSSLREIAQHHLLLGESEGSCSMGCIWTV